jgi:hypothetical protein
MREPAIVEVLKQVPTLKKELGAWRTYWVIWGVLLRPLALAALLVFSSQAVPWAAVFQSLSK